MDDTDLVHFRMDEDQGKDEAFLNLQEAITNWGKLLLATGGALKPIKCFFHLISFAWKEDGSWIFENNEEDEDFQARVPLADGSFGDIQHLEINEPIKTLGSITCPSESSKGSIEYMQKKRTAWKYMIKVSKLSRRNIWFMPDKQFWPRIAFLSLCRPSHLPQTIGMPYEGILQDSSPGWDQTHGQKSDAIACRQILWGRMPAPGNRVPCHPIKQADHALWQPFLHWHQHANLG